MTNGGILSVRSVRRGDGPALRRFYQSLSAETVYFRFGQWRLTLSRNRLARLCRMNGGGDLAFLAVLGGDEGTVIGEVRLNRLRHPHCAELSFVIADQWQGKGIGSFLMKFSLAVAKEIGLKTLMMEIMKKNIPMMCLASKFHFQHQPCGVEDDMEEMRLDLDEGIGACNFIRLGWEERKRNGYEAAEGVFCPASSGCQGEVVTW